MPQSQSTVTTLDALVVGAGISGIHQLYALNRQGVDVRMVEAGAGVGGVWFWNRYPGARFDSESYTYGYFFSPELIEEWDWSEEYAGQPETERYLNYVVDRFDLRRLITFDQRVVSAVWDGEAHRWTVTTSTGDVWKPRHLVTALGILSAPSFPSAPGLENFRGEWAHTGLWPDEGIDFTGKKVAVIGTGSSGVQIIPPVAKDAAQLVVFQRSPNWCTPINNFAITPERMADIRGRIGEIWEATQLSPSGSMHRPMPESSLEMSADERRAHFDRLYDSPGLIMALGNFRDVSVDKRANDNVTAYIAERIRARVHDPEVAERLIPKDHGFGQKRPPLENGYYEVFNEPHVSLVSTGEEPIVRFTETGIETVHGHHDLDVIVFATGFEAVVGSYNRIDIHGRDGLALRDHWEAGPRTYLGLTVAGFPNLFLVGGPQSVTGVIPRATDFQADWVAATVADMRERGRTVVEPTEAAEDEWIDHVNAGVAGTLLETAESWAFGSNVPGRKRAYLLYAGGLPQYRERVTAATADAYRGFTFSS
ncbi:NAD(P)/FAD-dependent oxidoreductase [Yinghuangia sp. ASG 101]|uniref:flavin-containing monooxygenase n=1 Tax=Yinghuangia sp. ASG 101 TaxID=2896848 RepID=UPI001E2E6C88|nr:NAD(P)/FAD-dependent oxidoreductase [Yinghuangia sp. ASG 101]UGQ11091.1 NAD(P)/FAD-dependent oxidoreductase [Yinghuangia sp. ASG 101]